MPNIFDRESYQGHEPEVVVAGDRWAWRKSLPDYPASLYTLTYQLVSHGDQQNRLELTAVADGDDHIIEAESTTTAQQQAGTYRWASFIKRNADDVRGAFQIGTIEVAPDPAADGSDPRSYWRRMLDDIEQVLSGRMNREALSAYTLGGRSLSFESLEELRAHRDYCARKVADEERKEAAARGQRKRYSVGFRL